MTVATSPFHWTEAYSMNIFLLDKQHQKLFDTVNELDQALRAGGNRCPRAGVGQVGGICSGPFRCGRIADEKA
jgi:hypothetical protein